MPQYMADPSNPSGELTDHEHAELLSVYQSAIADITFFKSQQFTLTNYGILIYVAIVGVAGILKEGSRLESAETIVLLITALVVLLIGILVLGSLETALQKGRGRLERCVDHFSERIKTCVFQTTVRAEDKPSLVNLFRAVFVLGFLAVAWVLWVWNCGI